MSKNQLSELDSFTQGYIECALWSSNDESDEYGGNPLDSNYGASDIAEKALKAMCIDCENFRQNNADLLESTPEDYTWKQAGHDFWLTRNHHGTGFWDRGLGKVGEELSALARAFGECCLYVGDDGKIHF